MLRGDVDRFYHHLRKDHPQPPAERVHRLDHVREIAAYYARLPQSERLLLLAWAKKEESGIGVIPLALSSVPLFGLIFSARIDDPLGRVPTWAIFLLWGVFGLLLVAGFYVHQRQKAYSMLHIVLLEQAIKQGEAEAAARAVRTGQAVPVVQAVQGSHAGQGDQPGGTGPVQGDRPEEEPAPTPPLAPGMH